MAVTGVSFSTNKNWRRLGRAEEDLGMLFVGGKKAHIFLLKRTRVDHCSISFGCT